MECEPVIGDDIYDQIEDQDRARELRRHNKERLAVLNVGSYMRQMRLAIFTAKRDRPRDE